MTVVLCSGCFDPLHPGHLAYFEAAKAYGDKLVVSLTSDRFVREQKGAGRPCFPERQRLHLVRALRIVDLAFITDAPSAVDAIDRIRPAVYVKGPDYLAGDPSGRLDREREAVESVGGRLVIVDPPVRYSSTALLKALP